MEQCYTPIPICEHIKATVNFKDYCKNNQLLYPLEKHSKPLHFKFTNGLENDPGAVFWTKKHMNDEWGGLQDKKTGMILKRPCKLIKPHFPNILPEAEIPSSLPKAKPNSEYQGFQDALEKCAMPSRKGRRDERSSNLY